MTIWDTKEGELLYRPAETAEGTAASLVCDESGLVLAAVGNKVLLLASDAPRLVRQLSGHGDDVVALAWEQKRRLIASGEANHNVRVWDFNSGECIAMLRDHFRDVRALAFSPDGHWLATGGADFLIHVYETDGWKRTHTFRGHTADVEGFDFSHDSRFLASCGWDETGRVWDIRSGRQVMSFRGPMLAVRFAADQRHLVAAGRSRFAHWRSCEEVAPAARLLEMAAQRVRRPLTGEERQTYLPFLPEAVARDNTP